MYARRLTAIAFLLLAPSIQIGAQTAPAPTAPPPEMASLTITPDMLSWDPVTSRLILSPDALPAVPAHPQPIIAPANKRPEAALLRQLAARGVAAGLQGVLYDNRDRGHSALPPQAFPQMTRIVYDPALVAQGVDYGLAGAIRFPAITLGNSSTAMTKGPMARSLPRLAMTEAGGPERAWGDYTSNAIYIYPEHRDHDANDMYPAAWPYMLVSQGSSLSDQLFLRAVGMILSAFRPDTRARLQAEGLVAPTVQMVLRRAQSGVHGRAEYLSGAAHPSAFDRVVLAPEAMVALANSILPGDIPPLVRLDVLTEDFSDHAGLLGLSERLYDTPSAIARLWRGMAWQHEMTVSAAATQDPNGRPLQFDWVLLRGDPTRVKVIPLDGKGLRARIIIDWQGPRPAPQNPAAKAPPPLSNRVDIGVFANNGAQDSAPAFISVDLPDQQLRRYEPAPDGTMRLAEVEYDATGRDAVYDPALFWSAPWRDVYHYDVAGRLTGWTRTGTQAGQPLEAAGDYGADGRRLDGRGLHYVPGRPGRDLSAEVDPPASDTSDGSAD